MPSSRQETNGFPSLPYRQASTMTAERRQEPVSPVTAGVSPDTTSPTRRFHIASSPLVRPRRPHWTPTGFSRIDVLPDSTRMFHALCGSNRHDKDKYCNTFSAVWLLPLWLPPMYYHEPRATNRALVSPRPDETMRNTGAAKTHNIVPQPTTLWIASIGH